MTALPTDSSTMEDPRSEGRGVIVGMLLGAAFWGAIGALGVWWLA